MAGFADRVHWTDQVFILGASRTKIPPPPPCIAVHFLPSPILAFVCVSLCLAGRELFPTSASVAVSHLTYTFVNSLNSRALLQQVKGCLGSFLCIPAWLVPLSLRRPLPSSLPFTPLSLISLPAFARSRARRQQEVFLVPGHELFRLLRGAHPLGARGERLAAPAHALCTQAHSPD